MAKAPDEKIKLKGPHAQGKDWIQRGKGGENMMNKLMQFLKEEEGTEVVEWALILLLVIILVIAAVTIVGQKTSQAWQSVAATLSPS